jgi:septum formation protein
MLEAAGLSVVVDKPDVDEAVLKQAARRQGLDAAAAAGMLAQAKAETVAQRHPGRMVLGCDQMLDCDGRWFDKPLDRASAVRQIADLAGKTHTLFSAAVVMRDRAVLWSVIDAAEMCMRPLSEAFIGAYLDRVGAAVLGSVGGYQIEGVGIQLFDAVRGDHFTILGLPLLPLLDFLRREGAIAT